MDENQILPNKEGVEQKAIKSRTHVKLFICGKSTTKLCVSVTGER